MAAKKLEATLKHWQQQSKIRVDIGKKRKISFKKFKIGNFLALYIGLTFCSILRSLGQSILAFNAAILFSSVLLLLSTSES